MKGGRAKVQGYRQGRQAGMSKCGAGGMLRGYGQRGSFKETALLSVAQGDGFFVLWWAFPWEDGEF